MKINMELGDTQLILKECQKYGCLRNQAAYILATAYWETARTMKPVKEAFWKSEAWRKRNLRYFPWYGRGYVQLTWKRNYVLASKKLKQDFTSDPEAVMIPENAAKILVAGSMEGWFTGRSIPVYITLQRSNYNSARKVINGTDKAQTIADIAVQYEAALKASGYGEQPEAPVDYVKPQATPEKPKAGILTVLLKLILKFLKSQQK